MNWERQIILKSLREAAKEADPDKLMDWLQERGMVADNAAKLEDVPTIDLFKAHNKHTAEKIRLTTL
jgi:hypothetical protein